MPAPYKPTLYEWLQIPSTLVNNSEDKPDLEDRNLQRNRGFKMLCFKRVLPLVALYLMLEEISAAVLPSGFRNKREVSRDQELFSRPSDQADLSVGDEDVDGRSSHPETFQDPTEHLSVQNQFQFHRKANDKRRKIAPLDSIGSFQMSSFRNRKDKPEVYRDDYMA